MKGGDRWVGNLKSHLLNRHPEISKAVDEEGSKKKPAPTVGNFLQSKITSFATSKSYTPGSFVGKRIAVALALFFGDMNCLKSIIERS